MKVLLIVVNSIFFALLILIIVVALIGYMFQSLTFSGVLGTIIVGAFVLVGFNFKGLLLLGAFFASSSLLSKFKIEKKQEYLQSKLEKGEQRDIIQVLANGGVPAIIALFAYISPENVWQYMFIIAIAAANSDTWASELGSLSKYKPVFVLTLKRVDPGTSGAVSIVGTFAGLAGSIFIAIVSVMLWKEISITAFLLIILFGFLGNLLDTLFGATIQVSYRCETCGLETEKTVHCEKNTSYKSGYILFNNDMVNFSSILLASVIGGVYLM